MFVPLPVEPFCGRHSVTEAPTLHSVPGGFGGTGFELLPLQAVKASTRSALAAGSARRTMSMESLQENDDENVEQTRPARLAVPHPSEL
jgi:hypothetical protein